MQTVLSLALLVGGSILMVHASPMIQIDELKDSRNVTFLRTLPDGSTRAVRFFTVTTNTNWNQADAICKGYGGLGTARVFNAQDNNAIVGLIRSSGRDWWVGLFLDKAVNQWKWVDGTPHNPATDFSYWAPGEPNNNFGNEACVEYRAWSDYRWNDCACGDNQPVVCEA